MNSREQKIYKQNQVQKWIIFFLVLFLIIILSFLFFKRKSVVLLDSNFSLLDPLRNFTSAESYITNLEDLRSYLRDLGAQYPDSITIYYENINSGANIAVNKDLRLFPASLSKLVQAIVIVKKVEEGALSFDQKLKVSLSDISSNSGELYKQIGENTSFTVDNLLQELLINSDNTAQNVFKHYVTFEDYLKFQNSTGLQDLYNEKGFISAKEYTRILRVLYTSNFLKPENSQKILEYMSKSTFKDYLSKGIPENVIFAHKHGENKDYNIYADSGIVYIPGKPYMISVIIKGKDGSPQERDWAVGLMKEISTKAYNISK